MDRFLFLFLFLFLFVGTLCAKGVFWTECAICLFVVQFCGCFRCFRQAFYQIRFLTLCIHSMCWQHQEQMRGRGDCHIDDGDENNYVYKN